MGHVPQLVKHWLLSWFFGCCSELSKDVGIFPEVVLVPAFTLPSQVIHMHDFTGRLDIGEFSLGHLSWSFSWVPEQTHRLSHGHCTFSIPEPNTFMVPLQTCFFCIPYLRWWHHHWLSHLVNSELLPFPHLFIWPFYPDDFVSYCLLNLFLLCCAKDPYFSSAFLHLGRLW